MRIFVTIALLLAGLSPAAAQTRRQPQEAQLSVTVTNRNSAALHHLFITPSASLEWGDDRLGDDTVARDARKSLRVDRVPSCRYDIRAIYDDGSLDLETDVNLCAAPAVVLAGRSGVSPIRLARIAGRRPVGLFLVENATGVDATELTVGPRAQLGGSVIDAKDRTVGRFNRATDCKADIVAEFKDAMPLFLQAYDLCAIPYVALRAPEETVSVRFRNLSAQPMAQLFVRPAGFEAWGGDRLGSSTIVQPRDFKAIAVAAAGGLCLHDVKATFSAGPDITLTAVDLCQRETIDMDGPELVTGKGDRKTEPQAPASPKMITVTIRNDSARTVRDVHVSAARSTDWGDSRTSRPLVRGATTTFSVEQNETCLFDLKAIFGNGQEQRRMNQDLCRNATVVFGGGIEKVVDGGGPDAGIPVRLLSAGRSSIQTLFLTPSTDTHWGDDRLGSNNLERGARFDIRLPRSGGCLWDMRIGFGRESREERRKVNLCEQPEQVLKENQKPGTVSGTGTGFYVSSSGHVLTNWHVVEGCRIVQIPRNGQPPQRLSLIRQDAEADIAVLKADVTDAPFLRFRSDVDEPLRPGERAIVVGYPVRSRIGVVNITEGVVSAAGRRGQDAARLQFTAPVQPGNSGGPVLDGTGRIIGVVVSRLAQDDDQQLQNVNFGVSLAEVEALLKAADITVPALAAGEARATADIFEQANAAVLPLDCVE